MLSRTHQICSSPPDLTMSEFELYLNRNDFKFSCAHFVAHHGVRERLHGHNYTVSIRLIGSDQLNSDGYLVDFGVVKKEMRAICMSLNESFISPMKSPALKISQREEQLCIVCDDGSKFSFPVRDCSLLPIQHSSVEQLAHYVWCRLVRQVGVDALRSSGVKLVQVGICEVPIQEGIFRAAVPASEAELEAEEAREFLRPPTLCFADDAH